MRSSRFFRGLEGTKNLGAEVIMAALKKSDKINLIPKDKFTDTLVGRVLTWLMSTFRVIVIIVEMVVMIAFLSRFWLDAKSSDLDDEIESRIAQIQAQSSVEREFNLVQQRLGIFSTMISQDKSNLKEIKKISSYLPSDVFLSRISLTESGIKIDGLSPSEMSIAQFIVNLSSIEDYSGVNLTQVDIDNENSGLLSFNIDIKLNN